MKRLTHQQLRRQARDLRARLNGLLVNYAQERAARYRRIIAAIKEAQQRQA